MAERSSDIYFFFFMNVNFGLTFDTSMSKKIIKKNGRECFLFVKSMFTATHLNITILKHKQYTVLRSTGWYNLFT